MKNLTRKQLQEREYNFPYHYLDLNGDEYKLIRNIEYLSYLKIVKSLLKPFTGQLILDAGCGDGRFCYELKNEKAKIIGVDFSEKAIKFAKVFNPNVKFLVQDLKSLNLSYKFDYIVLIETLEHFKPKEMVHILKNLFNVLKNGGKLVITIPSKNLPITKKHFQHFSEDSLRKILKNNFKILRIIGHSKNNFHKKIFSILKKIALLIFPFRNKIKSINYFYRFLKSYYNKHLEIGSPRKCDRLIVVCKRKK